MGDSLATVSPLRGVARENRQPREGGAASFFDRLSDDDAALVLQLLCPRDLLAFSATSRDARVFCMAGDNAAIWQAALIEPPRPTDRLSLLADLHRRAVLALAINQPGNDSARVAALRAATDHFWTAARAFCE